MRARWIRWLMLGAALLLAGGVLGASVLYWLATWMPPEMVQDEPPPPTERQQAEETAQKLASRAQAIRRAARTAPTREFLVPLTEAELNALLRSHPRIRAFLQAQDIQRLRVELDEGYLTAAGKISWQGRPVYLTATGQPQIVDGRLRVPLREARIGRLTVPSALQKSLEARLNQQLERLCERLPARPVAVAVETGTLRLTLRASGGAHLQVQDAATRLDGTSARRSDDHAVPDPGRGE